MKTRFGFVHRALLNFDPWNKHVQLLVNDLVQGCQKEFKVERDFMKVDGSGTQIFPLLLFIYFSFIPFFLFCWKIVPEKSILSLVAGDISFFTSAFLQSIVGLLLQWEKVDFFDNKVICDLIEARHQGVIALLVSKRHSLTDYFSIKNLVFDVIEI